MRRKEAKYQTHYRLFRFTGRNIDYKTVEMNLFLF